MTTDSFRLSYAACRDVLIERLEEPAPGRIQLLSGPRQVGKTTLLLELAERLGPRAVYGAADAPEAALPGYVDRLFRQAEEMASSGGRAVIMLDEPISCTTGRRFSRATPTASGGGSFRSTSSPRDHRFCVSPRVRARLSPAGSNV